MWVPLARLTKFPLQLSEEFFQEGEGEEEEGEGEEEVGVRTRRERGKERGNSPQKPI